MKPILPRPPWSAEEKDNQTLKYDLQWCHDELKNLEADIRELEGKLFDKEEEIEELLREIEELRATDNEIK